MRKITYIFLLCIASSFLFIEGAIASSNFSVSLADQQKWSQSDNANASFAKIGESEKKSESETVKSSSELNWYVVENVLHIKNIAEGSVVEIYNALGSRVQRSVVVDEQIELNDLAKGIYIVRIGKLSKKIVL